MAFDDPNQTIIARVIKTASSGKRVEINGYTPNGLAFFTGLAAEAKPGVIQPVGSGNTMYINFKSPEAVGFAGKTAELQLETLDTGVTISETDADRIKSFAADFYQVGAPSIVLGDSTPGLDLEISDDGTGFATIKNQTEVWHAKATTPLTGTWNDVAGARFGYFKDAAGNVHLRGLLTSGSAAPIVTLPVGYRPSSNLDFTVQNKITNGIASVGVNTGGVVQVSTNFVANMQVYLDVISYPTA